MEKEIYRFLTYILSPSAFVFYTIVIFSLYSPSLGTLTPMAAILIGSLFLSIIPSISIFYFNRDDLDIRNRKDRSMIYVLSIISSSIVTLIFMGSETQSLYLLSLLYTFLTAFLFLVNIYWKISAHTTISAGMVTAIVFVFGIEMIPLYALSLLAGYTRVKLKVHYSSQVLAAFMISPFLSLILYLLVYV